MRGRPLKPTLYMVSIQVHRQSKSDLQGLVAHFISFMEYLANKHNEGKDAGRRGGVTESPN